jgi:hypothetical protein
MAALEVIGLVLGVISMAPMLGSMLPDKTDMETNIRIGVGTSINRDDTTGTLDSQAGFFQNVAATDRR